MLDTLHMSDQSQHRRGNSEWPRIASGQPGSIASKIYSRVHKASRRHLDRGVEDHSPRIVYNRSKHRSVDSDPDDDGMRDTRKKSRRRGSEATGSSQSPLTERSGVGHQDRGGHHAGHHQDRSRSPAHHFEHHHHESHRSQESENSVTSNKYFAFHPSASPKRNRSNNQSQVQFCQMLKVKSMSKRELIVNCKVLCMIY